MASPMERLRFPQNGGNKILAVLTILSIPFQTLGSATFAQPIGSRNQDGQCFPNDPDGTNPGNLCLTYPSSLDPQSTSWSPLPNTSTTQPPFIQGLGKDAYYGYRVSPTQPGRIIGTTSGYWTNVEAVNGSTTITDSTGKIITAP